jgi:hypothetical protein
MALVLELKRPQYLDSLRQFLQQHQSELWHWFKEYLSASDPASEIRFELLKSTYRIDPSEQPKLYDLAKEVKAKLDFQIPLTLYQAQNPQGLNASIVMLLSEAHIILHGPVSERLTDAENRSLLAHELSHLKLWREMDSSFFVTDQLISSLASDETSTPAHIASARLFRLHTEIYCDRGALQAVDDPLVVISALVKSTTGTTDVKPQRYLEQANELFENPLSPKIDSPQSEAATHPECFIRARAIALWAEKGDEADDEISMMLTGHPSIDELDLLGQHNLREHTKTIVQLLLQPTWFKTTSTLAHARLFFDNFELSDNEVEMKELIAAAPDYHETIHDYFCFLLLDFVTSDRDLEDLPLAQAFCVAHLLGITDRFSERVHKELKIGKRQLKRVAADHYKILQKAEQATSAASNKQSSVPPRTNSKQVEADPSNASGAKDGDEPSSIEINEEEMGNE